ncbi:hypothetical protein BCR37DRAFT_412363 [Protomyces lactucae-debilis]|uniref:DIS3-like exonuclease 2 n=1 Tax=Protomyces lactucae-debilis TaxID=2754530 RepID=A0A1Y2FNU0_PROLT|nr:uncharacterized protein BCR37DRAFT_412363 [Protomyces lactucae-debilis]ORY85672.1 hypothetical protein BCR37DRAFT_412363 [Protomyces lactucae-debilis]
MDHDPGSEHPTAQDASKRFPGTARKNRRARRSDMPDSRVSSQQQANRALFDTGAQAPNGLASGSTGYENHSKLHASSGPAKALNFAPQPIASASRSRAHVKRAPAAPSPVVLTTDDLAQMTPEELMLLRQEAVRKKLEREAGSRTIKPVTIGDAETSNATSTVPGTFDEEKNKKRLKEFNRKEARKAKANARKAENSLLGPDAAPVSANPVLATASPKTPKFKLVEPANSAVPQSKFQTSTDAFPDVPAQPVESISYEATIARAPGVQVPDARPSFAQAAPYSRTMGLVAHTAPTNGHPAQPARSAESRARNGRLEQRASHGSPRIGGNSQVPPFAYGARRGIHGRFELNGASPSKRSIATKEESSSSAHGEEPQHKLAHAASASPADENEAARAFAVNKDRNQNAQSAEKTKVNELPSNNSRQYFDAYISKDAALEGVDSGKFHKGTLRISPKARKDAWVSITTKAVNDDFLIEGDRARNRALNGDEVIIEVVQAQGNASTTNGNAANHEGRTRAKVVHIIASRPLARIAGIIRPPGWDISSKELDERAIIANQEHARTFFFQPQDNRVPFIVLHQQDLPSELQGRNWVHNILQKQKTLYAARIIVWSEFSRFPRGRVVSELGTVGNIEAETAAILADCDVDTRDHPPSALACLPATPWSITPDEIARRRDFRKDRVCTIDPETARDLDDALSVRELGNGLYEIGVHIADVSHFIEQDSALDMVARERATTVYMVQRAIPMLPRLLCEELCSLNPAVDRLAFSVTWTMDADGNEVGPRWYGRSVIRSAVRFAYGEAQNLLDGQSWADGVGKAIDGGHTEAEITQDVKTLLRMSKAMRAKRFDNGALTINAFKLNFKLNKDGIPGVAEVYELKDANRLIEEFMLKANISVAERIVDAFPEHALLRMHPPPKDRPLQEFVNYAARLGIDIDASSSSTLQEGFVKLGALAKTNPVVAVLQNTAVRSMRRAEYICTGLHEDSDTWSHYALAVPLYTHFTSPIRRYADVVVHRLLDRALRYDNADKSDPEAQSSLDAGFLSEECEAWAKNCNVRKDNARTAQERSSMLYLCAFIEEECKRRAKQGVDEGYEVEAIIVSVKDRSLDIIVPSMALEKRIYYDKALAIGGFVHDENAETTTVTWRTPAGRLAVLKARQDEADAPAMAKAAADAGQPGSSKRRGPKRADDERAALIAPLAIGAQVDDEAETSDLQQGIATLAIAASENEDAATVEFELGNVTTTLKAMSKVTVWLRGNFDNSPCEIDAGLVLPVHEDA